MLEVSGPFTVTDTASIGVLVRHQRRLRAVTVRADPVAGIALGSECVGSDDIMITPDREASVVVDGQTYRGRLRIRRVGEGLVFDNHVNIESYLCGVLRGELPHYFHPESFKAQAVAARTYVLYQKQHAAGGRTFDVFDNESSQMYLGVRGEEPIAVQAVRQTRGEVCVWDDAGVDRIFCTYYSSTCGGSSQHVNNMRPKEPAAPPLTGNVVCNDCYLARFYRWDPVELSKKEVTKRLVARYPVLSRLGTIVRLQPKSRTPDGRISRMLLVGRGGENDTLVGEDFRLAIGGRTLKSTRFDIAFRGDSFIFKNGRGYGHGVGLCQHGMETKARRGMEYAQILTTYYPGAKVEKIY